ncbi:hypothetical protein B8A39_07880, partial [Dolosigranulum pigrum]
AGEEAINNATTAEEVAEAKQAGLDSLDQITIDGEAKQEALKELHAKATEKANEIDQRIDLTEEEKDLAHTVITANYEAGEEAINNATTAEEVAEAKQAGLDSLDQITIDGEAKQEAQNELHKVAQAKENEIEERGDLTAEEKFDAAEKLVEEYNKAVEAINSAETNDDVTTAKDAGIQAIKDIELDGQTKGEAIENIDALPELTEDQKDTFKQQVKDAETLEDVQKVLDVAEKQAHENQYKEEAKGLIDELEGTALSPERKEALKEEIDQAETIETVDEIIGKAEAEATDNLLSRKKAEAKNGDSSIDSLTDLSEETRNNLKDQIDAAENEEEILEILAKAGNRNELNKKVKEAIDGIPELTDDQRDKYKKEVEEATSDDEVESVLSELENQAYENYKDEAKDNIDALPGLTNDQKEQLKDEVDEAANSIEVGSVLGKAEKQAFENYKGEAKTEAVESIEKLKYVSDTDKENYIDRINNAEDISEINSIVGEAHNQNISNLPATDLGYENEIHVAPDNINRTDTDGNPHAIDSTGIPTLPVGVEEDGAEFHFGEKLPEGFKINGNPKWHGVEEIVFEGENESKRILFRLNKENGKVEVEAGAKADYAKTELPIEYVGTDGVVRGEDTVSILIRPADPTDPGQGTGGQGDNQDGTDSGNENDTPSDEPKEPFNPSAVDTPVDILGSDNDEAVVSAGDHDQIKKGVTDAPEESTLTIAPDAKVKQINGKPSVDVTVTSPDGTETKTVSVPVKQDLNKIVNNKLSELADHAKTKPDPLNKDIVTVKDQEKFRKYNETLNQKKDEIQKLLNDDANTEKAKRKLTEEERKKWQDDLDKYKPVKTPKTEILTDRINGDAESKDLKNPRNRAVHLRVGIHENGAKFGRGLRSGGHGVIQNDEMNFGDGDDTIETYNGIGGGGTKINLGNGNNELIIHRRGGLASNTFYNARQGVNQVIGGNGTDTATLTDTDNSQILYDVNIPKFDRVNLNGTGGQFNVKYDSIVKHQLGGNGRLIVSGVAGKNNSVDFNYGTTAIDNRPGSTFDADGTWTAIKTVKKDGNTYVVWRNSKDNNQNPQHEVWVQDTLNVRY